MTRAAGGQNKGYTILETMIFLAVSASMFISAMAFINGRQGRTEFTAATRNFEAAMSDIASDVSTGYYASGDADNGNIKCTAVGAGSTAVPRPTKSGGDRGENQGCTFVAKAVQFAPDGTNAEDYVAISIAGLQYKDNNPSDGTIQTIDDAKTVAMTKINSGDTVTPETAERKPVGSGVTVGCVLASNNSATVLPAKPCSNIPSTMQSIGMVIFASTFNGAAFEGESVAGNQVDMIVRNSGTGLNQSTYSAATNLKNLKIDPDLSPNSKVPVGGIYICLQSNGSNQYAVSKMGGQSSRFNITTTIYSGTCA